MSLLKSTGNNDQVRRVAAVRRRTREEAARRVERALRFIETDISRRLDLALLAAVSCMAKYHFLRRFKDVTGDTPHQFILRKRLARASELLLNSDLSAAEIGRKCGFADPSSFSSAFRSARGLPPKAWRSANALSTLARGGSGPTHSPKQHSCQGFRNDITGNRS